MSEDSLLAAFPKTVSIAEFGELIGMNDRGVRDLIRDRIVIDDKKSKPKRYLFDVSLKNYIKRLRLRAAGRGESSDGASLATSRSTLTELQSEEARIRIARTKGELVSIQDVADSWATIAQIVRSEGLAIASRVAFVVPHMTPHDRVAVAKVAREMLTNIAEQLEGAQVPGSAGGQEFETDMPAIKAKPVEVKLKNNVGRPRKA